MVAGGIKQLGDGPTQFREQQFRSNAPTNSGQAAAGALITQIGKLTGIAIQSAKDNAHASGVLELRDLREGWVASRVLTRERKIKEQQWIKDNSEKYSPSELLKIVNEAKAIETKTVRDSQGDLRLTDLRGNFMDDPQGDPPDAVDLEILESFTQFDEINKQAPTVVQSWLAFVTPEITKMPLQQQQEAQAISKDMTFKANNIFKTAIRMARNPHSPIGSIESDTAASEQRFSEIKFQYDSFVAGLTGPYFMKHIGKELTIDAGEKVLMALNQDLRNTLGRNNLHTAIGDPTGTKLQKMMEDGRTRVSAISSAIMDKGDLATRAKAASLQSTVSSVQIQLRENRAVMKLTDEEFRMASQAKYVRHAVQMAGLLGGRGDPLGAYAASLVANMVGKGNREHWLSKSEKLAKGNNPQYFSDLNTLRTAPIHPDDLDAHISNLTRGLESMLKNYPEESQQERIRENFNKVIKRFELANKQWKEQ